VGGLTVRAYRGAPPLQLCLHSPLPTHHEHHLLCSGIPFLLAFSPDYARNILFRVPFAWTAFCGGWALGLLGSWAVLVAHPLLLRCCFALIGYCCALMRCMSWCALVRYMLRYDVCGMRACALMFVGCALMLQTLSCCRRCALSLILDPPIDKPVIHATHMHAT
jgi:hypothetical protein